MKRTIEPDPYPQYPVLSDTQIWIEIAYLDPGPDYYKLLLIADQQSPQPHRRLPLAWIMILLLAICATAVLLWRS